MKKFPKIIHPSDIQKELWAIANEPRICGKPKKLKTKKVK